MDPQIPDNLVSRLSDLINQKTGLYFPGKKWSDLISAVTLAYRQYTAESGTTIEARFPGWLVQKVMITLFGEHAEGLLSRLFITQ